MPTTLVVDAYDSFVHIIAEYLARLDAAPTVVRNDAVSFDLVDELAPDAIVLGPGPGHPADAGYVELIEHYAGKLPIMGVCLGHQAIGLAYGGDVVRAAHLMHGKTSAIDHDGAGCFEGLPARFEGTRYHSLIVERASVPSTLVVSATAADDGYVMGLRHETLPVESVQFHPESISTVSGISIFANFLRRNVPALADA